MGWFTSNLSGQPHLYPTKKDYQHQRKPQDLADCEEKLHPTRSQYTSKTLQEASQESPQKYEKYNNKARAILQKLKITSHLSLAEIIETIEGEQLLCKSMGNQLETCLKGVGKLRDVGEVESICKNQLEAYRLCLESAAVGRERTGV